jgi:hypothetical protein
VLVGCSDVIIDPVDDTSSQHSGGDRKTSISQRIGQLKDAGLLDSLSESTSRSALENSDNEQLLYFINNTDAALDEIAQSENGEVQLRFIDALFNGATVGEMSDIMAEISEDMATQYLVAMEEQVNVFNTFKTAVDESRSVKQDAIDIRDIHIAFYDKQPNNTQARGIYGNNLDWDTVGWYLGFCAATTAGVIASSSWIPWIKIPGIVVAVAGGASMVVQLVKWYTCTDLKKLADGIKNKDSKSLTALISSTDLPQIATIATATIATGVVCYKSATGIAVKATVTSAWNKIVEFLLNNAPILKTTKINGITIAPIK